MLLIKIKTNAFSGLFFECIVDPSGFAGGGSSLKLKADFEEGKEMARTGSSHYYTWISGVSLSRMYLHWRYVNFIK